MTFEQPSQLDYMGMIKHVLLEDDFRLLKAFPMMVDYKYDIVYTPEIVDYFIDNYLFLEERYIHKIPKEAYSKEQYIRMMLKVFKSDYATHRIPHFNTMCRENFDIAIIALESKFVFLFPSEVTPKQLKKVRGIALKKLRSKKFIEKCYNLDREVLYHVSKYFIDRPDIIDRRTAKNYIQLTTRSSYSYNVNEQIFDVYDIILKKFPDMMIEVAETYHRTTMVKYISKRYIPTFGQEHLVDQIILHWNIDKKYFKMIKTKKDVSWESSGLKFLMYLLNESGMITTCVYGSRITYYRDGFLSYHVMKIFTILKDVNNMNAYVNSVYKKGS